MSTPVASRTEHAPACSCWRSMCWRLLNLPAELVIPQRHAVAHVVEHGLHQLAGQPASARAASTASLAAASACSRSFSSVMSRNTASSAAVASGLKLNSMWRSPSRRS